MSEDRSKLTSASKENSKTQGDWGGISVRIIVGKKQDWQKGTHYMPQPNYKAKRGLTSDRDYIINLPEGKILLSIAKVSLTALRTLF